MSDIDMKVSTSFNAPEIKLFIKWLEDCTSSSNSFAYGLSYMHNTLKLGTKDYSGKSISSESIFKFLCATCGRNFIVISILNMLIIFNFLIVLHF